MWKALSIEKWQCERCFIKGGNKRENKKKQCYVAPTNWKDTLGPPQELSGRKDANYTEGHFCAKCRTAYVFIPENRAKKEESIKRRLSSDKLLALSRAGPAKRRLDLSEAEEALQVECSLPFPEFLEFLASQMCKICKLPQYVSSWHINNDVVDVSIRCDGCCSKSVVDACVVPNLSESEETALDAYKAVLGIVSQPGLSIKSSLGLLSTFGIKISTSTFFRAMDKVMVACIETTHESFDEIKLLIFAMVDEGVIDGAAVSADGAWNHRREGTAHAYAMLVANGPPAIRNRILIETTLQKRRMHNGDQMNCGEHDGSANSMEAIACEAALEYLIDQDLAPIIKWIVSDQDSSAPALFRQYLVHAEQLLDPGHIKKNFKKTLDNIFGEGKVYEGFSDRMARFFMRIIKRSEAYILTLSDRARSLEIFTSWLDHLVPHYQRQNCPIDCPCNEPHDHLFKFPLAERHKKTLPTYSESDKSPRAESHRSKLALLTKAIQDVGKLASRFVHGMNTCANESFNYKRTLYSPKAFEFWQHHSGRSAINAGTHNLGNLEYWNRILCKLELNTDLFGDFLNLMKRNDEKVMANLTRKRSRAYQIRESLLAREKSLLIAKSKKEDKKNKKIHKSGEAVKVLMELAWIGKSKTIKSFACDASGCKQKCASVGGLTLHKLAKHPNTAPQ